MSVLKKDLYSSRKSAFAEGSTQNLKIQWESYILFCLYFGLQYLPSNTETLSLYVQFLCRTFKSTQSIKNYISGIKTMHLLLGFSTDNINDFLINLSLRGMARLHPYCIKQAQAITPSILLQFAEVLDFTNPEDIVFWCLFLFAFFLFARKSNLVPTTQKDFENRRFLLRKDVQITESCLIVNMRWSKTIQFGERVLQTPLIRVPGSALCPVSAYYKMCSMIKAKSEDPLFKLPNRKFVTYRDFQKKLKSLISRIGLNPNLFSSHSFRRGGASWAFQSKVPADLIQWQGDWKSDAYKKYLSFSFEDKLRVADQMRQHILLTTEK